MCAIGAHASVTLIDRGEAGMLGQWSGSIQGETCFSRADLCGVEVMGQALMHFNYGKDTKKNGSTRNHLFVPSAWNPLSDSNSEALFPQFITNVWK